MAEKKQKTPQQINVIIFLNYVCFHFKTLADVTAPFHFTFNYVVVYPVFRLGDNNYLKSLTLHLIIPGF